MKWTAEEVFAFLRRDFPQAFHNGWEYRIEALEPNGLSLRLIAHESQLRPGGTISGPAMMQLVDFAMYAMLLALHGEGARLALTTNLSISFLRKPAPGDVVAELSLLKHGRTLSVGDVRLYGEGRVLVAHAECTYHMG